MREKAVEAGADRLLLLSRYIHHCSRERADDPYEYEALCAAVWDTRTDTQEAITHRNRHPNWISKIQRSHDDTVGDLQLRRSTLRRAAVAVVDNGPHNSLFRITENKNRLFGRRMETSRQEEGRWGSELSSTEYRVPRTEHRVFRTSRKDTVLLRLEMCSSLSGRTGEGAVRTQYHARYGTLRKGGGQ